MMRKIGYNSQRNDNKFSPVFPGWKRCFSTVAWMFMSYYAPYYRAEDDAALDRYFDDVEAAVGKPGIGERVRQKFRWITGNTSLWWLTQKEGIEAYLWRAGVKGQMVFHDGTFAIAALPAILKDGPVIIGTKKIGGLPGGHIILLVHYDADKGNFLVNDPYGNARVNYADFNGRAVVYPYDWLTRYIATSPGKCRCMVWRMV